MILRDSRIRGDTMQDLAYQNAVKRREKLQAEIDEIDRFLALWKHYASTEAEQNTRAAPEPVGVSESANLVMQPVTVSPGNVPKKTDLPKEELAPHIRQSMLDKGKPMTRGQIVRELASRGINIGGVKPNRNMGTIMWRLREQFVNIENEGYWPKDLAYEPAGYSPRKLAESGETG